MSLLTELDLALLAEDERCADPEPALPSPQENRAAHGDHLDAVDRALVAAVAARLAADEAQRCIDESAALAPFFVVAPLTPEQAYADERRDVAKWRLQKKIDKLHESPAPRHLNCGRTHAIHCRRPLEGGRVEDALIRTSCGRSDCPHCWRRRVCRTYRRAGVCLLDSPGEQYLPRTETVYVGECDWPAWPAFDRALRRQHGGTCGRVRVRRADNTVLIVAAKPFRGATPMAPHEAFAAAGDAIDELHTARHAYRQLGNWADKRQSEWKLLQRLAEPLDFAAVQKQLAELSIQSKKFRAPDLKGLVWRGASEADADALFAQLFPVAAPVTEFAPLNPFIPQGLNSDTPPPNLESRDNDEPPWGPNQWV